jgi:DivIVA domain-containing protein
MIDLTPLEVRKKKGDFRRVMRGYDPALVDDFLDLVADRLEELVRTNLTLQARVARQDEQVTDYRDRERALTEALVSAQEMREEVRKQAVREAELSTRSAQQHAEQLRAKVEEEVRQLRSSAKQEAAQVLSSIQQDRQREEETVRQLRARQHEFLSSYRAFLEQELSELGVIARAAGVTDRAANTRAQRSEPVAAARPVEAAPAVKSAKRQAAPASPPAVAAEAPPAEAAQPERAHMDFDDGGPDDSDGVDEAECVVDAGPGQEVEFDEEPFEPEPFVEDESIQVAEAFRAEAAIPVEDVTEGVADEAVAPDAAEARLYDGIAADEDGDGVPGPIGLGAPADEPWSSTPEWTLPDLGIIGGDSEGDGLDLDDLDLDDEDEDDEETSALLRNAAAAGYKLDDDAVSDELLLDETVTDDDAAPADDGGWLPTLLEDDK